MRGERRLCLTSGNRPGSIMLIDRDERCCFVDRHFGRMFGLQPQSILRLHMPDLCSPETCASLSRRIARALDGEATRHDPRVFARGAHRIRSTPSVP